MKRQALCCLLACAAAAAAAQGQGARPAAPAPLKPASAFSAITDRGERSAALFLEAGKVITSPRCLNCHPAVRAPTQGDDMHAHVPPMVGGVSNIGNPGLLCLACHQTKNVSAPGTKFRSIPGHPLWGLAPASMSWQDKDLAGICAQLKDMERNGGRDLKKISEHMAKDTLVGWAWHPGEGRVPAPGTQKAFGQLIQAWIDTGAQCPK